MIRPVIEYGDLIYENCSARLKNDLNQIQRKAGLICTGGYKHTENQTLMQELGWESLETRRKNHKIVQTFKIVTHIYPDHLFDLLSPRQNTAYNLGNPHLFNTQLRRTSSSYNSFFPSASRLWNSLPLSITNATSVDNLKSKIVGPRPKTNFYYRLCTGKAGIWLTRLRLELSALNYHRYTYNFINSPNCNNCPNQLETIYYYFFACNQYQLARQTLFDRLKTEIGIDSNTVTLSNLTNILIHGLVQTEYILPLFNIVTSYLQATNRFT